MTNEQTERLNEILDGYDKNTADNWNGITRNDLIDFIEQVEKEARIEVLEGLQNFWPQRYVAEEVGRLLSNLKEEE